MALFLDSTDCLIQRLEDTVVIQFKVQNRIPKDSILMGLVEYFPICT